MSLRAQRGDGHLKEVKQELKSAQKGKRGFRGKLVGKFGKKGGQCVLKTALLEQEPKRIQAFVLGRASICEKRDGG